MISEHYPISFIAAVSCAAVGFYAIYRSKGRPERANLARILFLASVWTSFSFSTSWTTDPSTNTYVARVIYAVAAFVPEVFCRFVLSLLPSPRRAFRWFVKFVGGGSVLFAFLAFHPDFLLGVKDAGGIHVASPGSLFGVFVIYSMLGMGIGFLGLLAGHKSLEGIERNKLKYFFWGFLIAYVGAGVHFFSAFTGKEPFSHDLLLLSYSVLVFLGLWNPGRDFNEILRRSLAQVLFGAALGVPMAILVWVLNGGGRAAVLVFLVAAISPTIFMKWREAIFSLVDRLPLLRGKFVRPDVLAREVSVVAEARGLEEWARRVVLAARDVFGARSANVLLRQEDMGAFLIKAGVGLTSGEMGLLSLPFDSPVVSQLESSHQCLLADALEGSFPQTRQIELADLRFLHACAIAPIYSNDRLFALVCVGPKSTGEMFNQSDVAALTNLAQSAQYALAAALAGQARGRQSAFWAHDLFRPFGPKGAIHNVARVLQGDFGPIPEAVRTALSLTAEDAHFVAAHMKRFMDPLVQERIRIQLTSLTAAYNRSRDRFVPFANEKGVVLEVETPPENQLVSCDASLIEHRVIANLLENAVRHTPAGGKVRLGYRGGGQTFVGFVEDTGPGFRTEDLPRLFEAGTQLDPNTKGLSGLGLASVKSVMEAHGGAVTVRSHPGQGARFEFIFPIGPVS